MFGPPGERPESYWSGRFGEVCHLSPSDLGDLTPYQLYDAYEYATGEDE